MDEISPSLELFESKDLETRAHGARRARRPVTVKALCLPLQVVGGLRLPAPPYGMLALAARALIGIPFPMTHSHGVGQNDLLIQSFMMGESWCKWPLVFLHDKL